MTDSIDDDMERWDRERVEKAFATRTEFNKGDTVHVSFDTTVRSKGDFPGYYLAKHTEVKNHAVKVVKPVDDPSTDPIGTVREWGAYTMTRSDYDETWPWIMLTRDGANGHEVMRDSKVVGAVPNTPAWEAWRLGTLRGAPPFPFIDVDQVVEADGFAPREFWDSDGDMWTEAEPGRFFIGNWRTVAKKLAKYRNAAGVTLESLRDQFGPLTDEP